MILVDTSIWIDHIRAQDVILHDMLMAGKVLTHPWVIGEVAVGLRRERKVILDDLADLPQADPATDEEIMRFIEVNSLFGTGIGYIDAGLLASTKLTSGTSLWTRDKRLRAAAEMLSLDAKLTH